MLWLRFAFLLLVSELSVSAFFVAPRISTSCHYSDECVGSHARREVACGMSRVKRGKLGKLLDADDSIVVPPPSTPTRRKTGKPIKSKGSTNDLSSSNISPDLAKFLASQQQQANEATQSSSSSSSMPTGRSSEPQAVTFTSFEQGDDDQELDGTKKSSSRRVRQSARQSMEEVRLAEIQNYVQRLEEILGLSVSNEDEKESSNKKTKTTTNIMELLATLRQLIASTSTGPGASTTASQLRALTASKTRNDYRLAWVGSDAAVCHVGTSLHKVPLARLQEVFLSLPGRNQIILQEVIRILGPFPNVKNTLQGSGKIGSDATSKNNVALIWNWTWESMIDGTGKELMGDPKRQDNRNVDLKVLFADPAILVAAVPDSDAQDDPLSDQHNGKNVLLFLRQENLEKQLELLRVA